MEVPISPEQDTVWLSQAQMVELYGRDVSVISRHINNVFKEGEVDKESNLRKMQIAGSDRPTAFYSLDVIISVGYRVKSKRGTEFRKWASSVLKDYLLRGYAVNEWIIANLDIKTVNDQVTYSFEMLQISQTAKVYVEDMK